MVFSNLSSVNYSFLLAPLLLFVGGCFGSDGPVAGRPAVGKVVGDVTYKGEPISRAYVTFHSLDSSVSGTGETDNKGRFAISTFVRNDGAVLGKHAVTIQVFPEASVPGVSVSMKDAPIPPKYFTAEGTPLRAEVISGINEFAFEVK